MQIQLEVKPEVICNMMISAIESGDPVTTAKRGGWCEGIYLAGELEGREDKLETKKGYPWYANEKIYKPQYGLKLKIIEVDDERTGHTTDHFVTMADMENGLAIMAKKFPNIFAQIVEDNTDAPCADIFLQCTLFGDEKYA